MMDLLGADLPGDSNSAAGDFHWSDGPLLRAIQTGSWLLLDELNLAPQTVLEGLNALLDHRSEIYIPELDRTFSTVPGFRVFAAQNPLSQGGGRKGLPKSFLNRFTKVHVDPLSPADLVISVKRLYPGFPADTIEKMVKLVTTTDTLARTGSVDGDSAALIPPTAFAREGAPWEFNLRDILRWCSIVEWGADSDYSHNYFVDRGFMVLFLCRMRCASDKDFLRSLFSMIFERPLCTPPTTFAICPSILRVGPVAIQRSAAFVESINMTSGYDIRLLQGKLSAFECLCHAVKLGSLAIIAGHGATGKSTMVRTLAHLAGVKLHELALTSATDTGELLGGFEQVDVKRCMHNVVFSLEHIVAQITHGLLIRRALVSVAKIFDGWDEIRRLDDSDKSVWHGAVKEFCAVLAREADNIDCDPSLVEELSIVSDTVDSVVVLNTGGRFEWVDGRELFEFERP